MRSASRKRLHGLGILGLSAAVGLLCAPAQAGKIRLVAGEIETGRTAWGTSAALSAMGGEDAALVLIQLEGPIQEGWLEQIESAGVTLHHYVPDYAYLATAPSAWLRAARWLPHVAWVGPLPDDLKIHPALTARAARASSSHPAGDELAPAPPADELAITILSVDSQIEKRLEGWGLQPSSSGKRPMGWHDTRVRVPASRLGDIAAIGSVFHIELQPHYELHGERAAQTAAGNFAPGASAPVGPGYLAFLSANGLTGGAGLVVQVQDDGLDQGDASNLPGTAHADIVGRIAGIFNATSDPLGDSEGGHGEINAGIVMGNATLRATDAEGYLLGQGVAPQASVYATKIFKNAGGVFDIGGHTFSSLAKDAQDAGTIVSNNSWGASLGGAYTADSAEFDLLTRDADPTEAGHQPILYFFSAGNSGFGPNTVGSPGTAKNVITVGAAENSDADGIDGCGIGPAGADNLNDLISFSSRGPNEDGRLGITVVSVGTHNQGPASTAPGYSGGGVCDQFWPVGQSEYARSSGTSHSAPTAAGIGLVVYEIFQTKLAPLGHPATPSPALVRAVLTTTATDLAGGDNGAGGSLGNVPSTQQGWGSVNLSNLLSMTEGLTTVDQTEIFTSSGQSFSIAVTPLDSSQPVKITLAWTDAPAVPFANPTLVNDLDLVVTDGSSTYLGNVFSLGSSVTGGTADSLNNLESVFIESPTLGQISVQVNAANIAGDGLPGVGGSTDQDFALFVWNGVTQTSAGTLDFFSEATCAETGDIVLSDADLRGAGTQPVQVTSEVGDVEVLDLVEQGATGVFRGSLLMSTAAVSFGDDVLQVVDGGLVTATYTDLDDGTGSPAVAFDSVGVDCSAPVISNVQIVGVTSIAATTLFDTNEAATGRLDFGLSCGALTQSSTGASELTAHAIGLTSLPQETTHFLTVTATDAVGNVATHDNGGACFSFTTPAHPDFFTEVFVGDNDLDSQSLMLIPDGSADFYTACNTPAVSAFPTDPTGGMSLPLTDDSFVSVALSGGKTISLYGESYSSLFVGSNGYITLDAGDTDLSESLTDHFSLSSRISGLFDDLDPGAGGTVSWKQLSDRVAVTFQDVPQFGSFDSNNFQIELFFDSRIRITHLGIDASDGLVGVSAGLGLPPSFFESDLSAYSLCEDAPPVDTDGDGTPDLSDNCVNVLNPNQIDTNQDGYGNLCDPDFNTDDVVGIPDFAVFRAAFGTSCADPGYNPDVDLNSDCAIGLPDFNIFRSFFGGAPGPSGLSCAGVVPCQ